MSNELKMATLQSIRSLHEKRWSQRRIARELGIDRGTVSRYLQRLEDSAHPVSSTEDFLAAGEGSKPAISPAGSAGDAAHAPTGSAAPHGGPAAGGEATTSRAEPGRRSECEPWRETILAKLQQGLTAVRIHLDLRTEFQAEVSYDSVRRFLKHLRREDPLPFRRMECAPGEEAQVDFGQGAPVVGPDGQRRRPHVFRVVLSYSRKAYAEASWRQTTEDFIRLLENAFWHFGGVPRTLIIDNLRAAVKRADWYDPELNPKLEAFCRHYGCVILPTRPYTPRHKGKVERGVGYVQDNALKGHTFASLDEQNRHLWDWESAVADTRIHGTTKQQVGQRFREAERSTLQPLPRERFPFFHEAERTVHRDGHAEVAKAYYSVPPEYVGRRVWVRWDGRLVRVFNHRWEQIAVHVRQEPGRFSTQSQHLASEKISGVERGAEWLLRRVRLLGPHCARWAETLLKQRGVEGIRVLQGLLNLARKHPASELEQACQTALAHQAFRLRIVTTLLQRQAPRQAQFAFAEEAPIIRPLSEYGAFVTAAIRQDAAAPRGFERHDSGVRETPQKSPDESAHRGPVASSTRPRSGYPSSGCSPAEPDSVSPDIPTVVPFSPRE